MQDTRETFFSVWRKHALHEKLEPMEKQLLHLMMSHPEYHDIFEHPEKYQDYAFENHENPFLHLGLHLTLIEQVSSNRPKGITAIYKDIIDAMGDAHHAEHHIMELLSSQIWGMVAKQKEPDEKNYIKQLKKLLKKGCGHHHT